MTYYSYKGQFPIEGLPDRIRLSDGSVRTDKSTFTAQELLSAGFIEVPNPPPKNLKETLLWENNAWVVRDIRVLSREKEYKLLELSSRRKLAEETFTFNGQSIKLDEDTQARINAALIGLERSPEGTTTPWQITKGVFVDFNATTLQQLGLAAFNHVRLCFVNAKSIATQINNALTLAELDIVSIESGWP